MFPEALQPALWVFASSQIGRALFPIQGLPAACKQTGEVSWTWLIASRCFYVQIHPHKEHWTLLLTKTISLVWQWGQHVTLSLSILIINAAPQLPQIVQLCAKYLPFWAEILPLSDGKVTNLGVLAGWVKITEKVAGTSWDPREMAIVMTLLHRLFSKVFLCCGHCSMPPPASLSIPHLPLSPGSSSSQRKQRSPHFVSWHSVQTLGANGLPWYLEDHNQRPLTPVKKPEASWDEPVSNHPLVLVTWGKMLEISPTILGSLVFHTQYFLLSLPDTSHKYQRTSFPARLWQALSYISTGFHSGRTQEGSQLCEILHLGPFMTGGERETRSEICSSRSRETKVKKRDLEWGKVTKILRGRGRAEAERDWETEGYREAQS